LKLLHSNCTQISDVLSGSSIDALSPPEKEE